MTQNEIKNIDFGPYEIDSEKSELMSVGDTLWESYRAHF